MTLAKNIYTLSISTLGSRVWELEATSVTLHGSSER
jgi:hypothetical protein